MVLKECCSLCGFPLDMERDDIFLDSNPLSIFHYLNNKCEECGYQIDGTSIKIVKQRFDEVIRRLIKEREQLVKFHYKFKFMPNDDRKEVCVSIPRFCIKGFQSEPDQEDILEPFSWNVVYLEVLNNTDLSKIMLNEIKFEEEN